MMHGQKNIKIVDTYIYKRPLMFNCRLHAMIFVIVEFLLYLTFQTQLTVLSTIQDI